MTCKRQGEARSDLHTLPGASRLDNIRCGIMHTATVICWALSHGLWCLQQWQGC